MGLSRKVLTAVAAISLMALIISGTYAWTSFNSRAINAWQGTGANPVIEVGGTLHDDHAENEESKQIYVENYGNEDLFVRIMLRDYMEVGSGAGLKAAAGAHSVSEEIIHNPQNMARKLAGGSIDDPTTWRKFTAYRLDGFTALAFETDPSDYWQWHTGGKKFYYPTPLDKRGDYSYVSQRSPGGLTANSMHADGTQAKETLSGTLKSMSNWKAEGKQIGNFWVVDYDGWSYWASPLKPGDATGLLLNRVSQIAEIEDDYYYGIFVEAQMATKDGAIIEGAMLDNYERFGDNDRGGWTDDGKDLMDIIVNSSGD